MSAANLHTGLSNAEVQAQIAQGKINTYKETTSKSTGEIIKSNTATFYNMLNVCLVSLVALTGHFRNALFFFAILGNTCVGIYQELRAKKTIESMSLLGKTQARVLRDGAEQAVDKGQIVLNDLCILKKGAQIPVDAVIVGEGFIEVDESMLTGEADPVIKQKGDKVFGGSLVLLGQAQAQACAVGRDVYINQLSAEAKTVKIQKSKLQRQINSIIKAATLMLVVVGPFLFIRQLTTVQQQYLIDWQQALLRALTGVIGMVPQGLVLLTSVALTVGVIHLARQRVLTQELSAIESLARVDVLCLDKTGTLTEGTLQLTETVYYSLNRDEVSRALAAVAAADQEQNATVRAIGAAFPNAPDWRAVSKMPFSSQTKWQAVSFEGHGTFILGAPDVVLPYQADEALLFCREAAEKGARTLALLQSPAQTAPETLPEDRRVLAVLLMTDQVRPDAGNVLNYFKAQGVEVRVISGDHLATVARICESVGLTGACVDAR